MTNKNTYDEKSVLATYISEVQNISLLSRDEEYEYAVRAKNGDMAARNRLIESNSRFVISVAKQYQNRGIPLEDLICEGNIGLINAIDKFEPEKGFHFISYAVWWIRQAIMKAIVDQGRMIRLPMNRNAEYVQVINAKVKLESEDREVSLSDIACECGLNEEQVKEILSYNKEVCSLDVPVGDDDSTPMGDLIVSESDRPEEEIMEKSLKEQFDRILSAFPERERNIIICRYGLQNHEPLSLKDVGDLYGLTKERIRQIEKKVLTSMSNNPEVREMKSYIA